MLSVGGVVGAVLLQGVAHATKPIPVDALASLPALQSVSMSPDGRHLVGLIPSPRNKEETALATWDTESLSAGPKVVTPSGDHMKFIAAYALKADKILAIARQEWSGDLGGCGEGKAAGATETFVTKTYLTGDTQKEFREAFADNTRKLGISKNTQRCFELSGASSLVDMLPLDPDRVIISQLSQVSLTANYYAYNLKTRERELLFKGGARARPSLFDSRTGKVLAKSQIEPINGGYEQQVLLLNRGTGQFDLQPALTTRLADRHTVKVEGIDDSTGKFYILTDQFSDKVQARMYDPIERKYDTEAVVADKNFSIGGLLFSTRPSNFNQVVGFIVDGPHRQTIYVEPELRAIQSSIKQAFRGQQVGISSYTDDLSKVLFTTRSSSDPVAYHLLLNRKHVVNLGSSLPGVGKDLTGAESWVSYKARDGREIPAILDMPAGWKQGDAAAPAIIMPHGGPWARDYEGWDGSGWVPMLTSRGYAVLRPQYRGTEGLGRSLWLAGDKEWGLKMSDDLDDGAAWLVSQNIAGKDRIAIFGYSYGGFAAVAATVRTPSPYQCAIAGAPVANLGRLGTSWSDNRLQRILQGQTVAGMDPMKNVEKAHLPIMLFNGTRDVRTPPAIHAYPFYEAVKNKVPSQFHWIADMPHSMPWYPGQQREILHLIIGYLEKNCGSAHP
jgi:pimeloyl-ACP methyl ester carboxylesterase